ncbi:MAG: adenosylmethionine decarboxylase [Verrucomicrobia bacterium]|nr:adenosylmethionine decarboxylase [Verrucomicrobiota bacterium]
MRNIFIVVICIFFSRVYGDSLPYEFQGVHFIASYCECDPEALSDVESLKERMLLAVEESGATILTVSDWVFPPSGLTMVVLLSESHASIHTYPEHGSCFVDLFTCGQKCSSEKFDAALRAYLKPQRVIERTLLRNEEVMEK